LGVTPKQKVQPLLLLKVTSLKTLEKYVQNYEPLGVEELALSFSFLTLETGHNELTI